MIAPRPACLAHNRTIDLQLGPRYAGGSHCERRSAAQKIRSTDLLDLGSMLNEHTVLHYLLEAATSVSGHSGDVRLSRLRIVFRKWSGYWPASCKQRILSSKDRVHHDRGYVYLEE